MDFETPRRADLPATASTLPTASSSGLGGHSFTPVVEAPAGAGWLKMLEALARGRWAWRLRWFELSHSSRLFTYSATERGPPLGMVPASLITAVRTGAADRTLASPNAGSTDLTLAVSGELFRLRAPHPEAAAHWLDALRSAAAAASPTHLPPPMVDPAVEGGATSIEAAAADADDPQPFPPGAERREGGRTRGASPPRGLSVSPPTQPGGGRAQRSPPPGAGSAGGSGGAGGGASGAGGAGGEAQQRRPAARATSPPLNGPSLSLASGSRERAVDRLACHEITPAQQARQRPQSATASTGQGAPIPGRAPSPGRDGWQAAPAEGGDGKGGRRSPGGSSGRRSPDEVRGRRSPEYGGRFGAEPWPTASRQTDRRPTHERYSYSPKINARSRSLAAQKRPASAQHVTSRLFEEGMGKLAEKRLAEARPGAADRASFDYPIKAGLELDGHRGDKTTDTRAVSRTKEANELRKATFAPTLTHGLTHSRINPATGQAYGRGRAGAEAAEEVVPPAAAWARLFAHAAERREEAERAEEMRLTKETEGLTFAPRLSETASKIVREGFVEDRLLEQWADSLQRAQEDKERAAEEEAEARAQAAALHAHRSPRSEEWRRRVDEKRDASVPAHERLYASHTEALQRLDEKRSEASTSVQESQRWDGSVLPIGSPRISVSGRGPSPLAAAAAPSAAPATDAAVAGGGGPALSAHSRLHSLGKEKGRKASRQAADWNAIVAKRLAGYSGTPAPTDEAGVLQAQACDRLYAAGQDQQRRAIERREAQRAAKGVPVKGAPTKGGAEGGDASADGSGEFVHAPPVRSVAENAARGAKMYFEAMVRQQQREGAIVAAKQQAEAQADEGRRRTASGSVVGGGASLYARATEQQARLERKAVERGRQLSEAELAGYTGAPIITRRAQELKAGGRSVEERVHDWWAAKEEKRQAATIASPTAEMAPPSIREHIPGGRSGGGTPKRSALGGGGGGYHTPTKTVETI